MELKKAKNGRHFFLSLNITPPLTLIRIYKLTHNILCLCTILPYCYYLLLMSPSYPNWMWLFLQMISHIDGIQATCATHAHPTHTKQTTWVHTPTHTYYWIMFFDVPFDLVIACAAFEKSQFWVPFLLLSQYSSTSSDDTGL